MKFEDLYKKANDNIHADKKIIDSLFSKTSHKNSFGYRAVALCAASVILIISISISPNFYKHEESKDTKILYKSNDEYNKEYTEKQETDDIIAEDDAVHTPEVVSESQNTPIIKNDSNLQTSDIIIQHDIESDNDNYALPAETASEETASEEPASMGISGGSSVFKARNSESDISMMPYDEYVKYLGWDILRCNLVIPDGMIMSVPDSVAVKKDKLAEIIVEDAVQYIFSNPDKSSAFLSVSASLVDKNAENIYNSTEKIIINKKEVAIIQNDITKEAYTKTGSVWLHITSIDVADDEFAAFLQSLIQ